MNGLSADPGNGNVIRLEIRAFYIIVFPLISTGFGCWIQNPVIDPTRYDFIEAVMNPVLLSDTLQDLWPVQRNEDRLQEQISGIEEGFRTRTSAYGVDQNIICHRARQISENYLSPVWQRS